MSKHSLDAFLEACEATGPLLLLVESAEGAEQHLLHQPFAIIGRNPSADIVVQHEEVSRRHVYLQVLGGFVFYVDLQSRTGTRGEDGVQANNGWLFRDQALEIGPYKLRLLRGGRDAAQPVPPPPLATSSTIDERLPPVTLELSNELTPLVTWAMQRQLVLVGSRPACKVWLRDG